MHRIAHVAVLAIALAPAHGQVSSGTDEAAIEEVVVVGTRRAARDVHGLSVPVDVLNAEKINTQGSGAILDALASLVPSYNVSREPISDVATQIRPANMRGLPAVVDAELTLAFLNAYTVSVGTRNLLDKQPDKHQFAAVSGYLGADFPLNLPSGFNGGSYYVHLDANF